MSSYIEPRWENKHAPCGGNNGCPAFTDIAASLHAVAIDDYKLAWEIMMETHPLRSTLGRVCYSFCEQPCNRGDFDSPIAIKALEAVIGDVGFDPSFRPKLKKRVGKKVAIIGAGPAGLAAGWFLNIHGFDVTILERESKPGGMLEYGIPSYRLPKDILKRETDLIIDSGIGIRYNEDIDLAKLEKFVSDHKYDALLVASGSSNERPATFKGSTGALSGIKLLKDINQAKANRTTLKKKDVIVIGGGNVAMDVSRSAIRLGAKSVTIVYRRTRELMPAFPIEIEEAIDEGVKFEFLRAPTSYSNGNLQVEIMQLEDIDSSGRQRPVGTGKHTKLKGDKIIVAIGQVPAIDIATLPSNIYVAGDVVPTSKGTVIHAIADGKVAAASIASDLANIEMFAPLPEVVTSDKMNIKRYFEPRMRLRQSMLPMSKRVQGFDEVEQIPDSDEAKLEALRCFRCGLCIGGLNSDCDWCFKACVDDHVDKLMVKWTRDTVLFKKGEDCHSCGKCWEDCPRYVVTPVEVNDGE